MSTCDCDYRLNVSRGIGLFAHWRVRIGKPYPFGDNGRRLFTDQAFTITEFVCHYCSLYEVLSMTFRLHRPKVPLQSFRDSVTVFNAFIIILDRCNPWPHVANRHISISQLLSSCCYLFTVSNSGLLSVQRPRPASHAHFCHSHVPELICGVNRSID